MTKVLLISGFILILIVISGCAQNVEIKNNDTISTENNIIELNDSTVYSFILSSDKIEYEVGENPKFIITPVDSNLNLKYPINVIFRMTLQDGTSLEKAVRLMNKQYCHPCDPVVDEFVKVRGCEGNNCENGVFVPISFTFQKYITRLGTYNVSVKSSDSKVSINSFSFKVTKDEISNLIINKQIGQYKINPNQTRKANYGSSSENIPYRTYAAFYYDGEKELVVNINSADSIDIVNSNFYLNTNYAYSSTKENSGTIQTLQNGKVLLKEESYGSFYVAWPSGKYYIVINGYGDAEYSESEREFISEYLAKYPSNI